MSGFFDTIANIPDRILDFFSDIISMIGSVIVTLTDFLNMLNDFDATIVAMADSCGSATFTGVPIVDAIGTFRYLVGDVAFMMIYFSIIIGCLLTIYKLCVLLYEAIDTLTQQIFGVSCKNYFSNLVSKVFK